MILFRFENIHIFSNITFPTPVQSALPKLQNVLHHVAVLGDALLLIWLPFRLLIVNISLIFDESNAERPIMQRNSPIPERLILKASLIMNAIALSEQRWLLQILSYIRHNLHVSYPKQVMDS